MATETVCRTADVWLLRASVTGGRSQEWTDRGSFGCDDTQRNRRRPRGDKPVAYFVRGIRAETVQIVIVQAPPDGLLSGNRVTLQL